MTHGIDVSCLSVRDAARLYAIVARLRAFEALGTLEALSALVAAQKKPPPERGDLSGRAQ